MNNLYIYTFGLFRRTDITTRRNLRFDYSTKGPLHCNIVPFTLTMIDVHHRFFFFLLSYVLYFLFPSVLAGGQATPTTTTEDSLIRITIDASQRWRNVSSLLYGAFIEDINHAVEGGLLGDLLSDVQCNGPNFIGDDDSNYRVSLQSVGLPSLYIRYCDGHAYTLTDDGIGDATFLKIIPGIAGNLPNSVSFLTLNAPNTLSIAGRYLIVQNDGSLAQLPLPSNTTANLTNFNLSATYTIVPTSNVSTVKLVSQAPWASGYVLRANGYYPGDSGPCTWIGTRGIVTAVDPSTPPSSPDDDLWILSAPLQPSQSAWLLVNGSTGSTVNGNFDTVSPPLNSNSSSSIRLTIVKTNPEDTTINADTNVYPGICNTGFYGIALPNNTGDGSTMLYNTSFFLRLDSAASLATVQISLESNDGTNVYGTTKLTLGKETETWIKYTTVLTVLPSASLPDANARYCLRFLDNSGTAWLDVPSLVPTNTFFDRSNGMRNDLAVMVQNMHPAVFRFPGGCFVEGLNASTAVNFTRTIGPIETRPGHYNMWQYWSSDRIGLYEYLQFIEDIQAEPILVVNVGLYYGNGNDPVGPWIIHALNSLEFAMGDPTTTYWGSIRAQMGHPQPFLIRFLAVGNENYGQEYIENHYLPFVSAIRQYYTPEQLMLIANFNVTDPKYPDAVPNEIFDYHTYPPVEDFFTNQYMWDNITRTEGMAKVFNSEYAAKDGAGKGNLIAAVAEAVWMIGLERNSDLVLLACYAPFFVRQQDADWLPDAVMFNGLQAYGTPSYYNQVLFANNNNLGNVLLAYNVTEYVTMYTDTKNRRLTTGYGDAPFPTGVPLSSNATNFTITVALDTYNRLPSIVIKMVNYASYARNITILLDNLSPGWAQPSVSAISSIASPTNNPLDENNFNEPEKISIVGKQIGTKPTDQITLPPYSIHVLVMALGN